MNETILINKHIKFANNWKTISPLFIEVFCLFVLISSFVLNSNIGVLISIISIFFVSLFSRREQSIYHLAFFSSFSGIMVFEGKHVFFILAGLIILKEFLLGRINHVTAFFYALLITYGVLFCDFEGNFTFAKILAPTLLFLIPIILQNKRMDFAVLAKYYIFGFAIETALGFIVMKIPMMSSLFDVDLIWPNPYLELYRFFGLSYDSNFYALSNFIVIGYLLFCSKNIKAKTILLIALFLFAGILTFSKSYFLVIIFLFVIYFIKSLRSFTKTIILSLSLFVLIAIYAFVSRRIGFNPIEMILLRFGSFDSLGEVTTGRSDIWYNYIQIFIDNPYKFIFGHGYNSTVIRAAHNTFIEFLYLFGIIGTGIWICFFIHCFKLYKSNCYKYVPRSTMIVMISFLLGTFFLSAYTYESFWIGIVMSIIPLRINHGVKTND